MYVHTPPNSVLAVQQSSWADGNDFKNESIAPYKNNKCFAGRPSDDNTIFVKGFDSSLGEEGVREALTETFSKFGKVNQVRLPTDRETGDLKGIGFIEFETNEGKVGDLICDMDRPMFQPQVDGDLSLAHPPSIFLVKTLEAWSAWSTLMYTNTADWLFMWFAAGTGTLDPAIFDHNCASPSHTMQEHATQLSSCRLHLQKQTKARLLVDGSRLTWIPPEAQILAGEVDEEAEGAEDLTGVEGVEEGEEDAMVSQRQSLH